MAMFHDCDPLLSAKARIDDAIAGYLDKVAALRKRAAALQTAIDVLRSGDDELLREAPRPIRQKVVNFDADKVEGIIIQALTVQRSLSMRSIQVHLQDQGIAFSTAGLRRILKTSPTIKQVGVRDQTRYVLEAV
jgi:hypothetical protein